MTENNCTEHHGAVGQLQAVKSMKLESLKEKGIETKEIMAPKFPNLRKFTNQEAKRISITRNVKKTTPKSYHIKIKWLKICDRKKENLEWGKKNLRKGQR